MLIDVLKRSTRGIRSALAHTSWRLRGEPPEGSFFKQKRCREVALRYGCRVFIETGTFLGDTVEAMRRHVDEVHSIEVFPPLVARARRRFARTRNVSLYLGDSSDILPCVLRHVSQRALFWLDGHYSGAGTGRAESECPVLAELAAIAAHGRSDHCILIDDARLFGIHPDYPSIEVITTRLLAINSQYEVRVEADCIIALPPRVQEATS